MAKNETETAAVPTKQAAAKFSVEKLRENCLTLFGVTTSTFDGATNGLGGEYTVEEMKDKIAKWQNKEVR